MKALRKRWRRGRRVDAEEWQRASGGALREGSPNLRRDRGSRADGGDGEWRDHLTGGASGQDLPHSRPRRTERLRGKKHGDHRRRHDPLLPSSVLFVGAAGCLGARLTATTLTSGASVGRRGKCPPRDGGAGAACGGSSLVPSPIAVAALPRGRHRVRSGNAHSAKSVRFESVLQRYCNQTGTGRYAVG